MAQLSEQTETIRIRFADVWEAAEKARVEAIRSGGSVPPETVAQVRAAQHAEQGCREIAAVWSAAYDYLEDPASFGTPSAEIDWPADRCFEPRGFRDCDIPF